MADSAPELVAEILAGTVHQYDIPAHMLDAAEATYESVGWWLGDNLASNEQWRFYPQGSMRLGTVVRPSENDEYDIDAVAECDIDEQSITRAELKKCVGDALKSYVDAHRGDDKAPSGCEEGKRCWTLRFRQPFHMDVLPAIPDPEAPPTGIQLPDHTLARWQFSNPIAFANWFHNQARAEFLLQRAVLAKSLQVDVDDIPDWRVKTTLQQAVQALKVHRNIYFANDLDNRPPSVLLTTLAGHAYNGQRQLFETVLEVASRMHLFIEKDGSQYVVLNPVQPEDRPENFADRWGKDPELVRKFFAWLGALQRDLEEAAATKTGLDDLVTRLGTGFGRSPVQKAAKQFAERHNAARVDKALRVTETGALTTAGVGVAVVRDHTFHGI